MSFVDPILNGGLARAARERQRQADTGDADFFREGLYFFELRVPPGVTEDGRGGSYFHPLVLSPQQMTMTEPFALNQQFTLGGGLFVEENGILARELTVRATTGFRPRRNPSQSPWDPILPPEKRSHTRISRRRRYAEALSGQRHFQFLQDNVFRLYGDLKRDPATAHYTQLYFHNTRDGEKWRVFPMSFETEQTSADPLTYPHTFKLLCVNGVGAGTVPESEDKPVLDTLKTTPLMLRKAAQGISAAVQDLTGVQNQLADLVRDPALLTDLQNVADDVNAFLDGTRDLIRSPAGLIQDYKDLLESSLLAYENAVILGQNDNVPGSVLNTLRGVQDDLLVLISYPEQFQTTLEKRIETFNSSVSLTSSQTTQALEEAEDAGSPTSYSAWKKLGTGLRPGDKVRASVELGLGEAVPQYTGAKEYPVLQNDTLPRIAARHMGDARDWKILAAFNDLRPPYISEQSLPSTLKMGDKILVPDFSKPERDRDTPATLGTRIEQPAEEHFLGVDWQLEADANGFYDIPVDNEGGNVDLKKVRGRDCLIQAVNVRIATERGTDTLYQSLGIVRIIGLGVSELDLERAKFSVVETLQQDPRIADVTQVNYAVTPESPDVVEMDLTLSVRGITQTERFIISSSA